MATWHRFGVGCNRGRQTRAGLLCLSTRFDTDQQNLRPQTSFIEVQGRQLDKLSFVDTTATFPVPFEMTLVYPFPNIFFEVGCVEVL